MSHRCISRNKLKTSILFYVRVFSLQMPAKTIRTAEPKYAFLCSFAYFQLSLASKTQEQFASIPLFWFYLIPTPHRTYCSSNIVQAIVHPLTPHIHRVHRAGRRVAIYCTGSCVDQRQRAAKETQIIAVNRFPKVLLEIRSNHLILGTFTMF